MRIGASFALIGIGAVLKFAVTQPVSGVSLGTIGVIMMIVGVVGLFITLALMTTRRRTDVVYGPNGVGYVEPAADPYFFR
jgi:xanthine/uracil/vitamin C permease (AzgA family)